MVKQIADETLEAPPFRLSRSKWATDVAFAVRSIGLHFEWHPGGGAAVNPYQMLLAVC